MKVLHVTNNYPTTNFPIFGIFVKEQIESLVETGVECEVFFINGKENGKIEYFKSNMTKNHSKEYCSHINQHSSKRNTDETNSVIDHYTAKNYNI